MSKFIVPINFSPASKKIPIGEDIIYSTLASASVFGGNYTQLWTAHVLITQKGIAFTLPGRKIKEIYVDWFDVEHFNTFSKIKVKAYRYKWSLHSITLHFQREALNIIKSLALKRKEEWRSAFPNKRERKDALRKRRYFIIPSK